MKKHLTLLLTIILLVNVTGCSKDETVLTEQIRAVKVQKVQISERPVKLNYVGTLDAKRIIEYSFKNGGQIGRVFVNEGDQVNQGDKLLELNKTDIAFQVSSARLNMIKAEDSHTILQSNLSRMSELYDEDAISKSQYEQVKLEADIAENNVLQAKNNYEYQLSLERDATIYAEQDGMVVSIMSEEKERVNQSAPVIAVRSIEEVVYIGIPQQDLVNIQIGAKAEIDIDGQKTEGIITNLADVPDQYTRTYKAEVTVQGHDYRIGSIAKAAIDIGQESGIWIPITTVLSDGGEDYVYTVKDSRAFKRIIDILKQSENKILVKGLNPGESVATSGMKSLEDGTRVKIVE
ncbi:MAG: efflux RND transporter periplasmic adaptor subunit [Fermentimonas sp.]|nr:efflux RND transporter periplasmic adaptor subunit [Fermentimonas sp.]